MISLNGRDLTIEQVIRVTRGYEEVKIAEEAKAPMDKARAYVEEKVASGAASACMAAVSAARRSGKAASQSSTCRW